MNIIETNLKFTGVLAKRIKTEYLILHHAAAEKASAEAVHRAHLARGWKGIGYNYYVRKDGSVYRGRPENCEGAHTVGYNSKSIGVCFEGNFELEAMPAAQLKAGRELIRDILSRYPNLKIGRHKDYDATACPGRNFPFEEMTRNSSSNDGILRSAQNDSITGKDIVAMLTDEEAYELIIKADRHASTLDAPEWAQKELRGAMERGITDGENPMRLVPRYQAAIMAGRAR